MINVQTVTQSTTQAQTISSQTMSKLLLKIPFINQIMILHIQTCMRNRRVLFILVMPQFEYQSLHVYCQ
jgi:hypothetical protein